MLKDPGWSSSHWERRQRMDFASSWFLMLSQLTMGPGHLRGTTDRGVITSVLVTEVVTEVRVRTCDVTGTRTRELLLTPGLSPAWEV